MRFAVTLIVLWLVAGCNLPSPQFRGIVPARVVVEGSTFDVRLRGFEAEAMRVNMEYAPRFGAIKGRATRAMETVSGCEVVSVSGDQALAFGRLKCGGVAPTARVIPAVLECVPVRGSEIHELGQVRVDLDCDLA